MIFPIQLQEQFQLKHRENYTVAEAQRPISPLTTHNKHTLLESARSDAASSPDPARFGCRHAVFCSLLLSTPNALLLTPYIVLFQPAGTETQVTEQHAGHNSGAKMAAV